MPDRLTTLRLWLLVVMLATAVASIAIASMFDAPGIAVAIVVATLLIGEAWLAAAMLHGQYASPSRGPSKRSTGLPPETSPPAWESPARRNSPT